MLLLLTPESTAATTAANVKRGLVQQARLSVALKAALVGGIHESFAPEKAKYPFMIYDFVSSPYQDAWGSRMIISVVDIQIIAENPVDANDIDLLALHTFDGAQISVEGQTTLVCRRVADLPGGPDLDSEGRRIYQVGGSYEIWTDQPL